MKRILILSCFSAMFLMMGGEMEAVSLQKVGRYSSVADFSDWSSTTDRDIFSVEKYQKLVRNFYNSKLAVEVCRRMAAPIGDLYFVGKVLGFKKYNVGGKVIPTIDLSWPNIKRAFTDNFKNFKFKKRENVWRARTEKLISIIEATENVSHVDFNLATAVKDDIISMCLKGNDSLFNLSDLKDGDDVNYTDTEENAKLFEQPWGYYRNHFKRHLELMLENYTGFQRIMSLLTASIFNTTEEHAFVSEFNRIKVVKKEGKTGNCYRPDDKELRITPDVLIGTDYTILHESTHAYHDMIFRSLHHYEPAYHVLNSADADFVGLFFPMLTNERIVPVVKKLVEIIDETIGKPTADKISDMTRMIKHMRVDGGMKIILKIFKAIVTSGFANLFFSEDDTKLDIKRILKKEEFAKALYVYHSVISKDEKSFDKSSVFTNCEEALTIIGVVPITDGYRTYLVEDRQGEEIYRIRQLENSKDDSLKKSEDREKTYNSQFRTHSERKAHDIAICMLSNFCNIFNYEIGVAGPLTADNVKILEELIQNSLQPKTLRFKRNCTPTIAEYDSENIVRAMELSSGPDLLKAALEKNMKKEVEHLLSIGVKPNAGDLEFALRNGIIFSRDRDLDFMRILIKYGANPNAAFSFNHRRTLLGRAIRGGTKNKDIVEELLKSKHITYDVAKEQHNTCQNSDICALLKRKMDELKGKETNSTPSFARQSTWPTPPPPSALLLLDEDEMDEMDELKEKETNSVSPFPQQSTWPTPPPPSALLDGLDEETNSMPPFPQQSTWPTPPPPSALLLPDEDELDEMDELKEKETNSPSPFARQSTLPTPPPPSALLDGLDE